MRTCIWKNFFFQKIFTKKIGKILNCPKNIINLPKTKRQVLRQSLYLQGLTFYFYQNYFSQTLLIQGYLLTYHLSGVYTPKPVWHYPWHFVLGNFTMFFGQFNRLPKKFYGRYCGIVDEGCQNAPRCETLSWLPDNRAKSIIEFCFLLCVEFQRSNVR
jgi:hypothetical protein